jgi:hypothetical protein
MNVAITGHTAGIGRAFARFFSARGHQVVGLSKSNGHNIRNIPKIVDEVVRCDMWINNAQAGYAQTELLHRVVDVWKCDANKMIWIISTMMTQDCRLPEIPGLDPLALMEYRNQKRSLEDAFHSLKHHPVRLCLIRPGAVATQPYNQSGVNSADVDQWVDTVCEFYIACRDQNLWPEELSLGFNPRALAV